jgi:hypothetical protein
MMMDVEFLRRSSVEFVVEASVPLSKGRPREVFVFFKRLMQDKLLPQSLNFLVRILQHLS